MRKELLPLGLGAVAAGAAAIWLPASSPAGLREVVALVPLVLGLTGAVARALERPAWPVDERVAAVVLLGLALGHGRLGLPLTGTLVVLGPFGLVALRLLRLAPALARELGRQHARIWPFFALPLAAYLVLLPWTDAARAPDGDEPYYLLLAESLASDLDLDLADEYRAEAWREFGTRRIDPQPGDPTGPRGEIFSRHEPLLPLLLVPFWVAGGLTGARLAMLLASAALAAATLTACRALGAGRRGALRAWALVAFAAPVLMLSSQIWVEIPAALLVAMALAAYGRLRAAGAAATRAELAAFVLPLVLLPLLKLRLLAVALPLGLLVLAGARRPTRSRLAAAATVVSAGVALLIVNAVAWGNPLRMYTLADLAIFGEPLERLGRGGVGLFFDCAFGLIAAAPLWLLVVPGAVAAGSRRRAVALALAAFVPYLVLVAVRREWYGGWSPPFRYGVVALPALAAAVAVALDRRSTGGARVLIAALAALTSLRAAIIAIVPGWGFNLADGRSALIDLASLGYRADLARFWPSAVRPRPATWLVPLAAVALVLVVQRFPHRWPRAAASLGVAFVVAGWGALLAAGHRVPTWVAEAEDPWVAKSGGALWPGRWMIDRTRVPGAWRLAPGEELRVWPVAGGARVAVAVTWRGAYSNAGPATLEIVVAGRRLARLNSPPGGDWRTNRLGPFAWNPAQRLVVRAGGAGADAVERVLVDRVELDWD